MLNGGKGTDRLFGGDGKDVLNGNEGRDRLSGGLDADTFIFDQRSERDVIVDFAAAEGDRIQIDDAIWDGAALTATQLVEDYGRIIDGDMHLKLPKGHELVVENVTDRAALAAAIDLV